ncbi:MAG: homocysteine biosynthesis protein [Candidatus Marinimicrobia bacterium]|nr:homocysteine biosynthesis protein [Candidatus Neomarinimicrobiota bacterium]
MAKTYQEINRKIEAGEAVVLTAEEVSLMAEEYSAAEIAEKVDVVTTATFGPMCSSGAFINFGHPNPPMRMERLTLNGVEAYGGIAAADAYIGATQESEKDPTYGGAHVIEDLIAGKDVELRASAKGTDCYPRKTLKATINKDTVNEMVLHNPRNAYQNYPAATNSTPDKKYTYMGILKPKYGNVTYSTSGELSPLLNDPELRTIGIGTRIFLGGAQGYVTWNGTQFRTRTVKNEHGVPILQSATLTVTGDMKKMDPDFIKAAYYKKYGVSMFVGIGVPIPILDEDIAKRVSIRNKEIDTYVRDYGLPGSPVLATVNYEQLQSGKIILNGETVSTQPMSSLKKARQIAKILKEQILSGDFKLSEAVQSFPSDQELKSLQAED